MNLVVECVSQHTERQKSGQKGGMYWMLDRVLVGLCRKGRFWAKVSISVF